MSSYLSRFEVVMRLGLCLLLLDCSVSYAADVSVVDEACVRHRVLACKAAILNLSRPGASGGYFYETYPTDPTKGLPSCAPVWGRIDTLLAKNVCAPSFNRDNWSDLPWLTRGSNVANGSPDCEFDARYAVGAERCYVSISIPTKAEIGVLAEDLKKLGDQLNTNFVKALNEAFKCTQCQGR